MCKRIIACLIMIFVMAPVNSQEKKAEKKKTEVKAAEKEKKAEAKAPAKAPLGDHIYYETTIEGFEKNEYTDKQVKYFRKSTEEWYGIAVRDQYPAPIKDSKKYLGVKLYGKKGNVIQIIPPKKLLIDKFCRSLSIWVYGKKLAGELSILLKDANGTTHRLIMGVLDYHGWRKLTVKLRRRIAQEDEYLNQQRQMEILKFIYKPLTGSRLPREHRFYMDDVTAMVREKYVDRQTDDW